MSRQNRLRLPTDDYVEMSMHDMEMDGGQSGTLAYMAQTMVQPAMSMLTTYQMIAGGPLVGAGAMAVQSVASNAIGKMTQPAQQQVALTAEEMAMLKKKGFNEELLSSMKTA